jgi:hypothetical protein
MMMAALRSLLVPLIVPAFAVLGGCGSDDVREPAPASLDDVFEWTSRVALQETRAAVSVLPMVKLDPRGGFLVADYRESQVRRYAADGRLLWSAGRNGGGPGEFTGPAGAIRLGSGDVFVADQRGRLTLFDSTAAHVRNTWDTKLRRIEEVLLVSDSVVLLSGALEGDEDGPRLHLWKVGGDAPLHSFFTPTRTAVNRTAAGVAGWTRASRRGDTLAVTFSTSDTLYLFTIGGRPLGQFPLPSEHFRRPPRAEPRPTSNAAEQAQWMSRFDLVEAPYWLPDGSLLIAYQSIAPERALERIRHLLYVTPTGQRVFEVRNGPRLLAVDQAAQLAFFVDPSAEVPNQWVAGRIRR